MNTQKTTGYPSIDKPWMKYYTQSDKQTKAPTCTLYQNIYNNNSKYLKDIAIYIMEIKLHMHSCLTMWMHVQNHL